MAEAGADIDGIDGGVVDQLESHDLAVARKVEHRQNRSVIERHPSNFREADLLIEVGCGRCSRARLANGKGPGARTVPGTSHTTRGMHTRRELTRRQLLLVCHKHPREAASGSPQCLEV